MAHIPAPRDQASMAPLLILWVLAVFSLALAPLGPLLLMTAQSAGPTYSQCATPCDPSSFLSGWLLIRLAYAMPVVAFLSGGASIIAFRGTIRAIVPRIAGALGLFLASVELAYGALILVAITFSD